MYTYRTTTLRLQLIRHDDRIVFRDMNFGEVGYIQFTAFDDGLYIEYFEVYKPFRGMGYGTEMYEWVEKYAKHRGARRIILTPYDSEVGFWREMGFKLGPMVLHSGVTYEMVKELR